MEAFMKEKCINRTSLSKTLRFSLIPVGKTEENFDKNEMLRKDKERLENSQKVKKLMDEYYRYYLEKSLCGKQLDSDNFSLYVNLYSKSQKEDADNKQMRDLEDGFRKSIAGLFENTKEILGKDLIRNHLLGFLTEENDKELVRSFEKFSTYFVGFFKNRENVFSEEEKSTAVSYRCINDNLPKFIDNGRNFEKIVSALPEGNFEKLNSDFELINGMRVQDVFVLDSYNFPLSQSGIDRYNNFIGGYTNSDGTKVQGVNEHVNLYNQQIAKSDKSKRLPLLKPLYKQILSDRESLSFVLENFESDNELLTAVNTIFNENLSIAIKESADIVGSLSDYDTAGIYICAGQNITNLSQQVFGNWSVISDNWNNEYDEINSGKKQNDKYFENRLKDYKKINSFSIDRLQELGNDSGNICDYYQITVSDLRENICRNYDAAKELLTNEYTGKKRLSQNDKAVEVIKNLLDSIKEFEKLVISLSGTGKEEYKDDVFYGKLLPLIDEIKIVDNLYNKVRNYVAKKPYSSDKIKLTFDCSSFMTGWAKKNDYGTDDAILFEKEDKYYLGIIDKKLSKEDIAFLKENAASDSANRLVYDFQKPDNKNTPRLFIRSKGTSYAPAVNEYNLPIEDVIEIYDNGWFKTEYRKKNPEKYKKSLTKLIDYFKEGFSKHSDYSHYNYCWKNSEDYNDISEFYNDTINSCYQILKEKINFSHLVELADEGKLYLFQIYSKDFSESSHGTPNLHTLYFKMLFDVRNLNDVVYKLSGGAEMFYREASISKDEMIVHPKNQPIENKNPDNNKKTSTFDYDLIKDKRYTKRQFFIHIPITLNFKASSFSQLNSTINDSLKNADKHYVIGIDRGERNLIYVSVIDENENIVKQKSFNVIESENGYSVDYHGLLDTREKERDSARKSWKTIGNIKELKEGYVSQVVHEICELAVEYDAVIAMEDLNGGFINSRKKIDKQVYQKFENMLVTKLNYLVDKKAEPSENGGLLKAYQLTDGVESQKNKGKQNGIVFYVPAWLTSKIDPVTGFVDLLKPKYKSVDSSVDFFSKFDNIRYNEKEDLFEFVINYGEFANCGVDYRQKWIVCTNGERIKTFRNPSKNNEWDNETVMLTNEFKSLFEKFGINYKDNLKGQITSQSSKEFFQSLTKLLSLTLQMRNSVTGTDIDYLISPVRNNNGDFYDSRNYVASSELPCDADANGAYNIARKALMAIKNLKSSEDASLNLSIKNAEWLEYAQTL